MAKTNLLITTLLLTLLTTTTHAKLINLIPGATYEDRSSSFDAYRLGACISIPSGAANLGLYDLGMTDPIYKTANDKVEDAKTELNQATLLTDPIETQLADIVGTTAVHELKVMPTGITQIVATLIQGLDKDIGKAIYNLVKAIPHAFFECRKHAFKAMDDISLAALQIAEATDQQAEILSNKLGNTTDTSESNVLIEYKLTLEGQTELSKKLQNMTNNFENVFSKTEYDKSNTYSAATANNIVLAVQSAARKDESSELAALIKLYSDLKAANARLDNLDAQAKNDLTEKMTAYDTLVTTTSAIKISHIYEVRELLSESNYQVELSNADGKGWNQKTTIANSKHTEAKHLQELADDIEGEKAPGYLVEALKQRKAAYDAINVSVTNLESIVEESNVIETQLMAKYDADYNVARDLLANSGDFPNKYTLVNSLDTQTEQTDATYQVRIDALVKGIRVSQKVIALLGNGENKAKAINAILKEVNDGLKLAEQLNKAGVVVSVEKQELESIKARIEKGDYDAKSLDVSSRIESMLISAREQYSELDDYYAEALDLRDANLLSPSDLIILNRNAEYYNQDGQLDIKAAAAKLPGIQKELSEVVNRNNAKWESDSRGNTLKNLKVYAEPESLKIGEETKINARISLSLPRPLAADVEIPLDQIALFANSNINDLTVTNAEGITLSEDSLTFAQGLDYYTVEFSYTGALSSFSSFTKTSSMKNENYADVQIASVVKSRFKYDAVWPVGFESTTRNVIINDGVRKYASAPSELNLTLLAKENKVKLSYLVENPIDWTVSETPNGKHYKLTSLMDLDSAVFTKVEDTDCFLEKAQTNAGAEITAKAMGNAALISFNLKNLKAGSEKSFDLQVTCDDNSTAKLTTRKSDADIVSVETNALQRTASKVDSFDFNELSRNLTAIQSAYDRAFFTTGKNMKKYLSKTEADKLLSAGSKSLVKLEKQKGKPEFAENNNELSIQIKGAISKADEAINEVKSDAKNALEDGKNRHAQFGTEETEATLNKAVELYSKGEYLESLNVASQVTNLLPPASGNSSPSVATGNVVGSSTKDLTLYASIVVILLAIGYVIFGKKKEPDKPLTIIPSNNV